MVKLKKSSKPDDKDVKSYYFRMPMALYNGLCKRAEADKRSLYKEIIYLLEEALKQSSSR